MRIYPLLCVLLALMVLALPAAGASLPFLTAVNTEEEEKTSDNRYGYLYVKSVEFTMNNANAEIHVTYEIEPWISFLVYLFGKEDLKKRVLGLLQYPEAGYENMQDISFSYVGQNKAVLSVRNAALDNQDNSYWIRPHTFGCTIPRLTFIISENDIKTYIDVKSMAKGIGFFRS